MVPPSSDTDELEAARRRLAELERLVQERDDACAEVERQASFLRLVLESLHHPFYVVDADDYSIRLANRDAGFGDLAGRRTCHELTHGRADPCGGDGRACPLAWVKATKRPTVLEHVHTDAHGRVRTVEVHAHPVLDEQGQVRQMIEYCLDVTDRKRAEAERRELEDRVRQSHKMEAIGTLAGGVAHDVNNMLAAVLGSASLLQRGDLSEDKRQRLVARILEAAERGAALTRNLLGLARRGSFVREPLALGTIVEQVVGLLRASGSPGISLRTELAPGLPSIAGDGDQLGQLVMNLCLNALQASSPGDTVWVRTRLRPVGARLPPVGGSLPDGSYVELQVVDEGVGMSPEVLERAVEPFFTTKPPGQGTGLGLSMAFGTAQSHGGALWLESQPGAGTVATVLLPADPARGSRSPSPGAGATRGSGSGGADGGARPAGLSRACSPRCG